MNFDASADEIREWTSSDGRKIKAKILGLEGETVRLEMNQGKFEIPITRLSLADQSYAKVWANKQFVVDESKATAKPAKRVASTLGDFEGLELGSWPKYITADLNVQQIELEENKSEDIYIYRTPHFEFHSPDRLSISVVREFARIFEATFAFVDQMPIGLGPQPPANGLYQTKLYQSKDAYFEDGGIPGSGGMFTTRGGGLIKVPLPNLGVEYTGTRYIVDHKKRSTTLTHEIVHQVMMRWLGRVPVWLTEGLAEVVSSQEYNNGRFKLTSMNRAIAQEVGRGSRDFSMVNLKTLMNLDSQTWKNALTGGGASSNYDSSSVLAYYFLFLDGEGDGAHLVDYLKEISEKGWREQDAAQKKYLLRDRTYEELETELAKAWRSNGLKITFH